MVITTPKIGLKKPEVDVETNWGSRLNESLDILDDAVLAANAIGAGTVTITNDGVGNLTISGSSGQAGDSAVPNALIGADGITVTSGVSTDTLTGFRTEFVSASGSLQSQISAAGVDSINSATGVLTISGLGEVGVTTEGNIILVSGTAHPGQGEGGGGGSSDPNPFVGEDGITVTSGVSFDTLTGFRTEFVNASGTLSAEIDSDIATHDAITDAHHTKYTGAEAITALEPTTSSLAASGVATDATVSANRTEFINSSGSLQGQIDTITAGDVESVNSLTGAIDVIGKGEVNITVEGQNIVVSGTDHAVDIDTDTVSDAIIGGVGIVVTSGTSTTIIDAHLAEDAITGSDGITITSGTSTVDIQGFRTEFVNASGTLSSEIDSDITTHASIVDAHHVRYIEAENKAILGGTDITVTSGVTTITIDSTVTKPTLTKGLIIENPTATEDLGWFETPLAVTVTEVKSVLTGSATPSVTLSGIFHDTDRGATGNNVLSSGVEITSTTVGHIPPLAGDVTIPAGSFVWLETSAKSGTVNTIFIRLTYTED